MQIALRCEKCGNIFKETEEDVCLEIDFKEKTMSYICRNMNCRHDNILNFKTWQQQQKHTPLPAIRTMH